MYISPATGMSCFLMPNILHQLQGQYREVKAKIKLSWVPKRADTNGDNAGAWDHDIEQLKCEFKTSKSVRLRRKRMLHGRDREVVKCSWISLPYDPSFYYSWLGQMLKEFETLLPHIYESMCARKQVKFNIKQYTNELSHHYQMLRTWRDCINSLAAPKEICLLLALRIDFI